MTLRKNKRIGIDQLRYSKIIGSLMYLLKQTGFPKGEPDPLYRRDSPWISSYHIQNSFQLNITDITHVYNITWVYLLHNQKDCNTNSEYKPLGLKENKQKAETISSLLGKLRLHESSRSFSTGSSECSSGHPSHHLPLSSCRLLHSDPAFIRLSPRMG